MPAALAARARRAATRSCPGTITTNRSPRSLARLGVRRDASHTRTTRLPRPRVWRSGMPARSSCCRTCVLRSASSTSTITPGSLSSAPLVAEPTLAVSPGHGAPSSDGAPPSGYRDCAVLRRRKARILGAPDYNIGQAVVMVARRDLDEGAVIDDRRSHVLFGALAALFVDLIHDR